MDAEEFAAQVAFVRETRARHPDLLRNRHASRRRRPLLGRDGRLLLIEVDDPARGVLAAGSDDHALADRGEVLHRVCSALDIHGVDGVIATADVLDDLVLMDVLGNRLAVGTAAAGLGEGATAYATASALTGFDPAVLAPGHLDGGSLAVAVNPDDAASADRLASAARAVDDLSAGGIVALVRPSWWRGTGADARPDPTTDGLLRAVEVASALGSRSSFLWLVVPAKDAAPEILAATTLPVLVRADADDAFDDPDMWARLMSTPGIRGVILPVTALYPPSGDAAEVVRRIADIVHPQEQIVHPQEQAVDS